MTGPRSHDPLRDTDWVLVDGNNLLHALSASATPAPRAALIGRLRGAVPGTIAIDVVFDGPATGGLIGERIASGLRVRYAGRRSADAVLLTMVEEIRVSDGPAGTAAILVVTDDGDLRRRLHGKGARTAGAAWLLGRIERQTSTPGSKGPRKNSSGGPAPATTSTTSAPGAGPAPATGDLDEDDARRWEPGRRATVKKGNPRRRRRRATDPRR